MEKKKDILVQLMNDPMYHPMRLKELAILLGVPKERREELKETLNQLILEGKISLSTKGKYGKAKLFQITGVFEANQRGFGFVRREEGVDDIFIPEQYVNGALHGDLVVVVPVAGKSGDKRPEGKIINILSHEIKEVVGVFRKNKKFGFVIPDNTKINRDIFIPIEKSKGAQNGHKVVVKITDYGSERKNPEGRVTEIIGHVNDPGVDILSIVKAYELPMEFPESVMKQVEDIPEDIAGEDISTRKDVRSLFTVTIDGEDAKDLDDAITLIKDELGNYQLGVHIADVSHYVKEGSPLDKEAYKRGTSVYLTDRVIPMLPHKLSNGICSLNAGVDRLSFSCFMTIDKKGRVIDHEIAETVLHVDRRLSYNSVYSDLQNESGDILPFLQLMEELSEILRQKRYERGAIDFDFPESKIVLDEKGRPIDVHPYERNSATKIIEDFMLMANETIAEDAYWQQIPFLYRIHEKPDADRMRAFATFINNFGFAIHFPKDEIHPKELSKLLERIDGSPSEPMIAQLMLRSMKQAKYSTESEGHFGLSAKFYTHFTSPIRRYPDLQIHRILKETLQGKLVENRRLHYEKILPDVAVQTSTTERRAVDCEREVDKLKKVQYMRKFVGDTFAGVISGVTAYGLYVTLENTVEGMVHVSHMTGDYYHFIESEYAMVGEMTGKTYRLGEHVDIIVLDANVIMKTIDFKFA